MNRYRSRSGWQWLCQGWASGNQSSDRRLRAPEPVSNTTRTFCFSDLVFSKAQSLSQKHFFPSICWSIFVAKDQPTNHPNSNLSHYVIWNKPPLWGWLYCPAANPCFSVPSKALFKRLLNQITFIVWSLGRSIFHDSDTNTTLLWLLLSAPKRPPTLIKLQTSPLPKLRWVGTISIQ